ncbi:LysR family transcriptional regulator [Paraburkholderia sp. EG286B]|uniref:LysR family transcriptional regulator n=1 Tax=Paraburkholderia sp. EG286B TaxID=3237011 RepID=UPI0034D1A043
MDRLQTMRIFTQVAEEGSFTGAARRMDTSTPIVSRAVGRLEAHLGIRLINRSTRSFSLTESGERYLQRCQRILAELEQAEAEAADAQVHPSGRLRVHAMPAFGQTYLVPAVMSYQQRYPSVSIDLTLSGHAPNIVDEGYDVAIQMSTALLPDSALVSQRLGTLYSVLCASPAYLRAHGTPGRAATLAHHARLQLVTSLFPRDRWELDGPDGRETVELPPTAFQVNTPDALVTALRECRGIGALPMPSAVPALKSGVLVRVLPRYQLQTLNAYVVYPSRQYLSAKAGTFVEFLREVVPQALAADHTALG